MLVFLTSLKDVLKSEFISDKTHSNKLVNSMVWLLQSLLVWYDQELIVATLR